MVESELQSSVWLSPDSQVIRDALESIGTPVGLVEVIGDGSFKPVAANRKVSQYYGFDFDHFLGSGKAFFDYDVPEGTEVPTGALEYVSRAVQNYQICADLAKPVEFETNYGSGEEVSWSLNTMIPILDGGRVVRILVTMVDVTYKYLDSQPMMINALSMCAWCQARVRVTDSDGWEGVVNFFHRNGVSISHGICDECITNVESKMEDEPAN